MHEAQGLAGIRARFRRELINTHVNIFEILPGDPKAVDSFQAYWHVADVRDVGVSWHFWQVTRVAVVGLLARWRTQYSL